MGSSLDPNSVSPLEKKPGMQHRNVSSIKMAGGACEKTENFCHLPHWNSKLHLYLLKFFSMQHNQLWQVSFNHSSSIDPDLRQWWQLQTTNGQPLGTTSDLQWGKKEAGRERERQRSFRWRQLSTNAIGIQGHHQRLATHTLI